MHQNPVTEPRCSDHTKDNHRIAPKLCKLNSHLSTQSMFATLHNVLLYFIYNSRARKL